MRLASTCTRVPAVVTVPLILLAIPSALIGWFTVKPLLFGNYFDGSIRCCPRTRCWSTSARSFTRPVRSSGRRSRASPLWLALAGVFTAWLFFYKKPALADSAERSFKWLHTILDQQVRLRLVQRARDRAGRAGRWGAACGEAAMRP